MNCSCLIISPSELILVYGNMKLHDMFVCFKLCEYRHGDIFACVIGVIEMASQCISYAQGHPREIGVSA